MSLITVPVSYGEVVDKITILEIKSERIEDPGKVRNVHNELQMLESIWADAIKGKADVSDARARLKKINEALWEIEDKIRISESQKEFGEVFVELARSVYVTNDLRADVKKEINLAFGSETVEEKSYEDYT